MEQKKKRKKWVKFRHKVVRNIAYFLLYPYVRFKYNITIEPFKEQGDRQYLIMMNHQTVFDQFFVGIMTKGPVYYIASEDIFSNGFISRLLSYLVAPIPIKKQATDVQAVIYCARVAKEGGTIALFPEGNRTYSGKTGYIKPSVVKLVKALRLPLVFYKVEGGYGVQPRWSDVVRKGKMRAYVSRVVEPAEYQALTEDALYEMICKELYVDEAMVEGFYYHKRNAEYLERAMYVCPDCGLSVFESKKDIISCQKCRKKIQYLPSKELQGCDGAFPFRFVGEWYDYQCRFVQNLDLRTYYTQPAYEEEVCLSEVLLYKRKQKLCSHAKASLYGNRIIIRERDKEYLFSFDEVSVVTVLGRNKVNIYIGDKVYQIKGDKHMNALKYVNMYYHYRNSREDHGNGEFLGL